MREGLIFLLGCSDNALFGMTVEEWREKMCVAYDVVYAKMEI